MESERNIDTERLASTSRKSSRRQRVLARLWRAEVRYTMALGAFAILALCAHLYAYFSWDLRVTRFLQTLPIPRLFDLMRAVSLAGDGWMPYALTTATVITFLAFRRRSEAVGLLLSAGAGHLFNYCLKLLIARPRPAPALVSVYRHQTTLSFPSGHVTFYVCYFGFLFFLAYAHLPRGSLARRLALLLTALPVLLVGLSRVYLGEHWSSDTLGAYLIGGIWLGFSLDMYRRWKS
jgi:undecaprenyl-diphosphatase